MNARISHCQTHLRKTCIWITSENLGGLGTRTRGEHVQLQHSLGLNQGPWRSEVALLLHTAPSAESILKTLPLFLLQNNRFCSQPYGWHTHFVTGSFLSVQDAMDLDMAVLFAHAEQSLVHRRSYQRIFNVLPGLFIRSDLKSKHMKFHSYMSVTPFNCYLVHVSKVPFYPLTCYSCLELHWNHGLFEPLFLTGQIGIKEKSQVWMRCSFCRNSVIPTRIAAFFVLLPLRQRES